jgi:hypothetical protein
MPLVRAWIAQAASHQTFHQEQGQFIKNVFKKTLSLLRKNSQVCCVYDLARIYFNFFGLKKLLLNFPFEK